MQSATEPLVQHSLLSDSSPLQSTEHLRQSPSALLESLRISGSPATPTAPVDALASITLPAGSVPSASSTAPPLSAASTTTTIISVEELFVDNSSLLGKLVTCETLDQDDWKDLLFTAQIAPPSSMYVTPSLCR
jgi:hypothetical protein